MDETTIRQRVSEYFAEVTLNESPSGAREKISWRIFCFESGLDYVRYVNKNHFQIGGRSVIDVACAWGGHALAFAAEGAKVVASDLKDHQFRSLVNFTEHQDLQATVMVANCELLPFHDSTFDVVLALELIEHIDSVDAFAAEVARILRRGGICILSTPPRLRSVLQGEPHFGLRAIAALPFKWQQRIAAGLFGRSYPYPIRRQYVCASDVIESFIRHGLKGFPVLEGRLAISLQGVPVALKMAREVFWTFLVVMKPTHEASRETRDL